VTVAQAIAKLQQLPPDAVLVRTGFPGEYVRIHGRIGKPKIRKVYSANVTKAGRHTYRLEDSVTIS